VHPDRRLVDLLGGHLPGDAARVDVDAERLGHLLDGDVRVILGPHVDPAVATMDCPTLRTDAHLDAVGRVDEVVLIDVTGITERIVSTVALARPLDVLATAGTELTRTTHRTVVRGLRL
jgi:hypothetical protein